MSSRDGERFPRVEFRGGCYINVFRVRVKLDRLYIRRCDSKAVKVDLYVPPALQVCTGGCNAIRPPGSTRINADRSLLVNQSSQQSYSLFPFASIDLFVGVRRFDRR